MTRDIRLIGLDLDGTVFNDKKEISQVTVHAITQAIEKGVVVLPATGRPLNGVPKEFLKIPNVRYALTANGANVYDYKEKRSVVKLPMYWNEIEHLILMAQEEEQAVWEVYLDGLCYVPKETHRLITHPDLPKPMISYFLKSRIPRQELFKYLKETQAELEKLHLMFDSTDARDSFKTRIINEKGLEVTSTSNFNIEINSRRAGKGNGLLALGKYLGIAREQIMACGDSENDRTMLEAAGLSVLMGNGDSRLREIADFVTKTNEEDGVAYAIRKFVG